MTVWRNQRWCAVLGAAALWVLLAAPASAATIVVDFNAAAIGTLLTTPYVEDGVTMSVVSGHYDIFDLGPTDNYANIDMEFSGEPSVVSFSLGGTPFTLESILFPFAGDEGILTASNGVVVPIPDTGMVVNFNIAGITSFTLAHGDNAFLGFDDITLTPETTSPEPATLLLLGLAGVAMRMRSRRKVQ